jgi:hypothetical protein
MKILLIIGAIILLLILGLVWLYRAGTTTTEEVIAEVADGPDRLTLKAVHTTSWGNSYSARVLLFNGELVDFRGALLGRQDEGNKVFPLDARALRVDILDPAHAETLRQVEILRKKVAYLEGNAPYDLLKQHYPDLENGSPWTLWANPKDFSETQYTRLVALLRQHAAALRQQQLAFENDAVKNPHQWLKYPGLIIWRTVYHDYTSLENAVFERKNGKTAKKVTIAPHGDAAYYQKSERYEFGYGCGLGQLNETADTLFISKNWETSDVTFPISEFAQFKDAKGRSVSECYKIVLEGE